LVGPEVLHQTLHQRPLQPQVSGDAGEYDGTQLERITSQDDPRCFGTQSDGNHRFWFSQVASFVHEDVREERRPVEDKELIIPTKKKKKDAFLRQNDEKKLGKQRNFVFDFTIDMKNVDFACPPVL
jgi:hypothetical protein